MPRKQRAPLLFLQQGECSLDTADSVAVGYVLAVLVADDDRADGVITCAHTALTTLRGGGEGMTRGEGTTLKCGHCGKTWELTPLGELKALEGETEFSHIPDWYRWEREEVRKEVQAGTYHFEDDIHIEDYYSTKVGFVPVGEGHVVHDENGFIITGTDLDGNPISIHKPVSSMYSVHIEYNFLNRGDAFDIATDETSYFMFLKNAKNYLTKMHFAQEELYDHYVRK